MLRNKIYTILSEIKSDEPGLSSFQEIRKRVIELCLNEFHIHAGEELTEMFIKKAYFKINTEWIQAVKMTKKDGINIFKENGFKAVMKGHIADREYLSCLKLHVN